MPQQNHHSEKALASFIRAGAERRPDQAYGDYFKGQRASCALGAAYEGMYRLPREVGRPAPDEGPRVVLRLPRRHGARRARWRAAGRSWRWRRIIVHLNDEHRWTREQIATWLEDEKANGRLVPPG